MNHRSRCNTYRLAVPFEKDLQPAFSKKSKTARVLPRCGVCSVVLFALLSGPAHAADDRQLDLNATTASIEPDETGGANTRFRKQVYAATGVGLSRLDPDTSEVQGVDVNDRVNPGGQITIGADLNKRFSLELHSADLGSAGLSPAGRVNYHLHGGSALVYAGKNRHRVGRQGLTGFGRIGLGMLENSTVGDVPFRKDNATHILFGAGLEYATRIGLGIRAEVISYEKDVQYGQLGLIYRLGRKRDREPVFVAVESKVPEGIKVVKDVELAPPVVAAAVSDVMQACKGLNGTLDGVNFHTNSATLTDSATAVLDKVIVVLAECETANVVVAAHTDSKGAQQYNQSLSESRANSVVNYLAQQGIEERRLLANAFGETQPAASNETSVGRAMNRRVELHIR